MQPDAPAACRGDGENGMGHRLINPILFASGLLLLAACGRDEPASGPRYAPATEADPTPVYSFAVHPLHNPAKLQEAYGPLVAHLNAQIRGARFELEASRDYASYEDKLRRRQPEFALPNPLHTIHAIKGGYHVLAMAGSEDEFRGVFIVRRDSRISKPQDLKGLAVSYPSSTALAACIMPQYFLHRAGIDVNKDIRNRYVGSQESSIMNVYLGESAVGVTWTVPWRLFQRDHPEEARQLKQIWQTPPLQNNSVMARADMPAALVDQVRQQLLRLGDTPAGQRILEGMAVQGFYPADDQSYAPVERFMTEFQREVRQVAL